MNNSSMFTADRTTHLKIVVVSLVCAILVAGVGIASRATIGQPQMVNGRMEGTWRHEIKGSRVEVVVEPFVKAPAWVRRAAGQEAERLAAFLGGTLSLKWKG